MSERSLHAGLKAWYRRPGDREEVEVDGYLVDLVRGDLLVEIQNRNLSAVRAKLADLVQRHPVRLVLPLTHEKWIVRLAPDGLTQLGRRKSPCRGDLLAVFDELVSIAALVAHPALTIDVPVIREEEVRRQLKGRGRKTWAPYDRRLLEVIRLIRLSTPADFRDLLPPALPCPFSTADLARALDRPRDLAQRIAYCLREMGAARVVGKRGNTLLYDL
jgi:hypothetical protein